MGTALSAPKISLVRGTAVRRRKAVPILLIGVAVLYISFFMLLPLGAVFLEALSKGVGPYLAAITRPETLFAVRLTLLTAAIVVPLNAVFGLAVSWAITKFQFRGKNLLITLIDLPLAVSPVVSGLIYILVFGLDGWFGKWLDDHEVHILFAFPGIVLATLFVTFPFVARELVPFMQSEGTEEEEAARVLGASGWQIFFRVTLPNIKWSLLYGVILTLSRAVGEFGAVSVVSGHIRGQTTTLPLEVEILYNEYHFVAAFAAASVLTLLAVISLGAKKTLEWKTVDQDRFDRAEEFL
jgi:sulfate transport system permease protein